MKDSLKNIGSVLLGICGLLFFLSLPILFLKGALWLAPIVLPWLNLISGITFLVCILVFLPLAIFRKTRAFAGMGLFFASFIFGISLWFSGFLLTYFYWGGIALIIGLCIAGVGVVPIAMLASAIYGDWSVFIGLILMAFFTFGARILGSMLVEKAEEEKQKAWLIDVEGTATSSASA